MTHVVARHYVIHAVCVHNRAHHVRDISEVRCDFLGGQSIQDECTKHVNLHGRLYPGKIYTSCAGRLPCRFIVHTVGPMWTQRASGM